MIFTSLVNYFTGIIIDKSSSQTKRKITLIICIVINLGFLGFFKYSSFFIEQFNNISHLDVDLLKVSLPIGISFYTFQNLSYSIDIYRKDYEVEKNFLTYLAYITMFPQLIAGPIVRFSTVRDELHKRDINLQRIGFGVTRFLIGLFKKVLIADNIAMLWNAIKTQGLESSTTVLTAWLGALCFTLELYFDFSGYSDMAIGMGQMLGFNFDENFNYPLAAVSVTDFWRRWHISLSTWFRDYVYIPLGGNRKGKARTIINILIVWTLTGFWHGSAWNFVFWGFYYGVLLILEKNVWGKYLEKLPKIFRHFYTLFIVVFGFTIFVFDDTTELYSFIKIMFGATSTGFVDSSILSLLSNYAIVLILALVFAMPTYKLIENKLFNSESLKIQKASRFVGAIVFVALFVVTVSYIVNASYSPFLYFRF